MKKLLVVFMVLAFAAPAIAADNLSVNGEMRVRSWDREGFGTFEDGTAKSETIEQRFRFQATFKANDQVKAVTRIDLAEDHWGSDNFRSVRFNDNPPSGSQVEDTDGDDRDLPTGSSNANIQVDRAYLDVTTGPVNVKAGLQFLAVGQSQVLRDNKPGLQITINTPVVIELGYSVDQDSDRDRAGDRGADADTAHLSVEYAADAFSVQGFYGQSVTATPGADGDIEDTRTVFGVNGKFGIGPVKFNTELALFGGDNGETGTAKTDYIGTQFNLDADMKFSDMFKLGVDLIYSDGTSSADEDKISFIGIPFGRVTRSEGGSGNQVIAGDLQPIGGDDVFDPLGDNLGALGLGVDAIITPVAGFDILLHVLYLTAAEDAATGSNGYDNALVYNLGLTYALAPKAKLGLYYTAVAPSFEGDAKDDTATNIGCLMQIAF